MHPVRPNRALSGLGLLPVGPDRSGRVFPACTTNPALLWAERWVTLPLPKQARPDKIELGVSISSVLRLAYLFDSRVC